MQNMGERVKPQQPISKETHDQAIELYSEVNGIFLGKKISAGALSICFGCCIANHLLNKGDTITQKDIDNILTIAGACIESVLEIAEKNAEGKLWSRTSH